MNDSLRRYSPIMHNAYQTMIMKGVCMPSSQWNRPEIFNSDNIILSWPAYIYIYNIVGDHQICHVL